MHEVEYHFIFLVGCDWRKLDPTDEVAISDFSKQKFLSVFSAIVFPVSVHAPRKAARERGTV